LLLPACTDERFVATDTAGLGGAAGDGGAGGAAGAAGHAEPSAQLDCEFEVDGSLSEAIPTVGIVEWSVEVTGLDAGVDSAIIEFGPGTEYGAQAPVDLEEPGRRTLLLGMKASAQYHFRVRARVGSEECVSDDHVLTTGPLSNGIDPIDIQTPKPQALAGGFLVAANWSSGPLFILDAEGDMVWWYDVEGMSRARLSHDGKYMWMLRANPTENSTPEVRRITMDGLEELSFPEFGNAHHDLVTLPGGGVAFIERTDDCDRIMEWSEDGTLREVVDVREAHGGEGTRCHTNSLLYWPDDDSFTFSDLFYNVYVKVTRDGEVVWVLGGNQSEFSGDGSTWQNQHGHHLLGNDRLLFFNNGPIGGGEEKASKALEVSLDFEEMTATEVFRYEGPVYSAILGDVQRLENGNTLVTFSSAGLIQEVDASGDLVRQMTWPLGTALGYTTQRNRLQGPPPK
jgi:hypothetical protein